MQNAQYYAANPGELLDDVISYAMENPLMFAFDSLRQNATHYIANPAQVPRDLIAYAEENPWKFTFACLGIALGIVSIVLPPVIGFSAAGPVLGNYLRHKYTFRLDCTSYNYTYSRWCYVRLYCSRLAILHR